MNSYLSFFLLAYREFPKEFQNIKETSIILVNLEQSVQSLNSGNFVLVFNKHLGFHKN